MRFIKDFEDPNMNDYYAHVPTPHRDSIYCGLVVIGYRQLGFLWIADSD